MPFDSAGWGETPSPSPEEPVKKEKTNPLLVATIASYSFAAGYICLQKKFPLHSTEDGLQQAVFDSLNLGIGSVAAILITHYGIKSATKVANGIINKVL